MLYLAVAPVLHLSLPSELSEKMESCDQRDWKYILKQVLLWEILR